MAALLRRSHASRRYEYYDWIVVLDFESRRKSEDQHETLLRELRNFVCQKVLSVTTGACFWYPNWYPKTQKEERTYILSNVSP